MKVLYSIPQQIWKTQQWPQYWKRSVFLPIPKKRHVKECSDYQQLHSSHTLAKECSKSPSLQQQVNQELLDDQEGCRKGRGSRQYMPITAGSQKKQKNSRKTCSSTSLSMLEPWTVWITTTGKYLRKHQHRTTEKSLCRSRING